MHSPFGYQPSKEEKEIKVLKERVERLEYILTELVTNLYNHVELSQIMKLVKTLKK